jgi:hypothetical protein
MDYEIEDANAMLVGVHKLMGEYEIGSRELPGDAPGICCALCDFMRAHSRYGMFAYDVVSAYLTHGDYMHKGLGYSRRFTQERYELLQALARTSPEELLQVALSPYNNRYRPQQAIDFLAYRAQQKRLTA